MGLLDALLGRTKLVPPDLDQLFGLPAAAITLQVSSEAIVEEAETAMGKGVIIMVAELGLARLPNPENISTELRRR